MDNLEMSLNRLPTRNSGRSRATTCNCGVSLETTRHMLECLLIAHSCSLDDLLQYNEVVKQCVEIWKRFDDTIKKTWNFRYQATQPTRGGAVTAVWQTLYKLCRPIQLQQWGPDYRFWGKPAMRTRWMAGNAPHKIKSGFAISNTQIQVRKQISIRCNRIEY